MPQYHGPQQKRVKAPTATEHSALEPRTTHDHPARKWFMLAIVSFGFIAMVINWFNISTGFSEIAVEFDLQIPKVALLVSAFVLAYGIMHVPGGLLATRCGLRRSLAIGLSIEAAGALLSATATSFEMLLLWRFLAGIGASIFAAVGIAAVSAWFRRSHHALALGVSSAAFSVGTALGLYTWSSLTAATSWRFSVAIGGICCLAMAGICIAFFRNPAGAEKLTGVRLTARGIIQVLSNRDVWLYGLAFFGAYGSYLGASQLISGYGAQRGIDPVQVGMAALLIGIAGIPGSIFAGWLADSYFSPRSLFLIGAVLEGVFLLAVPFSNSSTFWLPALGVGFMFNFTFAVWQTVPGAMGTIAPENIGTAIGLMLSISAIGGFVLPWVFGFVVEGSGYLSAWIVLGVVSIATAMLVLASHAGRRAILDKTGQP